MILCSIPILSGFLSACTVPAPLATGYVEGDYVLISPVTTAQIETLPVKRGDRVTNGEIIAGLEKSDAKIAVAQAEASVAKAKSELANLLEGKRPEEIQVIEATLASAQAQEAEAKRSVDRIATLVERGAATQTQLDDARTTLEVATAKVAEAKANLNVAKLPARPQQIAAAEAAVRSGQADLDKANWVLEKRDLHAPADGIVSNVIHRAGEIVSPSTPILSILPDNAVKLSLFLPEKSLSGVTVGDTLSVHCDGCAPDLTATITYIADGPEFTPPVIYSLQNRQKLVYLVEARPDKPGALKPGQIVDVTREGTDG
ncbi:MAG: HlyD family efflux transporter periplasmic adaptor subunit [Thioclava marina]|uniref:HlyD family secretion protein n=1 Tax=Thioclava marina TaxID=1915077 RepID=A0ABX3MQU1_9RHOB|nr:HlyD family efflux transporter periplasmic adaptor subunit [Thioclava marina]MBC7146894.1 HlyD family efflux transporter periplasmic adaptor subunit [Thioclava marina]OOY13790.1 HlyD family secretion protein [Thioclava marina]